MHAFPAICARGTIELIETCSIVRMTLPVADRWAIVLYVRALQRSQNAKLDDVPADILPALSQEPNKP